MNSVLVDMVTDLEGGIDVGDSLTVDVIGQPDVDKEGETMRRHRRLARGRLLTLPAAVIIALALARVGDPQKTRHGHHGYESPGRYPSKNPGCLL